MTHRKLSRPGVVALVLLLAVAACGKGKSGSGGGPTTGTKGPSQVNVYGVDGNTNNALGDGFKEDNSLAGMKGTAPLSKLSDDFVRRLKEQDPKVEDVTFAGETYDAIVVSALAAQAARSSDPRTFARYVNGVTAAPGEKCTSFKACKEFLDAGKEINYDGVSGPLEFTDQGEPSVASYGIRQFGGNNKLDDKLTRYVQAGDARMATRQPQPAPVPASHEFVGGPLKFGELLPYTGSLAFIGPPLIAACAVAVKEINAAGGVGGEAVVLRTGDSGDTSTNIAAGTVDKHLQEGVDVIIGGTASSVVLKVIDKVVTAGKIMFSPTNTADSFTTYDDKGLYFRTAPPDAIQAQALADVIVNDGNQRVVILAIADAYGTGLMTNTKSNLEKASIRADSIQTLPYEANASDFSAQVAKAKEFRPDAIVVIGFDESKTLIKQLNEKGVGPRR